MKYIFTAFFVIFSLLLPVVPVSPAHSVAHHIYDGLVYASPQKGGNAGTVGNSLYRDLRAYWNLDEASGTRAAAFQAASLSLTDNNTVTQATGKIGSAAQFTAANTEYLSVADSPALSFNNADFTIVAWVYMDAKPASGGIIVAKGTHNDATTVEYALRYNGTAFDRFRFLIGNGTSNIGVSSDNFGALSAATWYFVVAINDAAADTIKISVNDGSFNTATQSGPIDGTNALRIGANTNDSLFWDGRIDAVAIYARQLTAAEITYLYNSGNGRPPIP
jgi:hypothetical protein